MSAGIQEWQRRIIGISLGRDRGSVSYYDEIRYDAVNFSELILGYERGFMRITVNRQLSGGYYRVGFGVTDFTAEELAKMRSFGVPTVKIVVSSGGSTYNVDQRITEMNSATIAIFGTEEKANEYIQRVLNDVRGAMAMLREKKDEFTSTDQVEI